MGDSDQWSFAFEFTFDFTYAFALQLTVVAYNLSHFTNTKYSAVYS